MAQTAGVKVPFQAATVNKCLCPRCPVQTKSTCVSGKLSTFKEALKAKPPKKEDIPAVYCSTGTATCSDIDTKQSCRCGGCPVYSQYNLDSFQPVGKFCRDGAAH